MKYSDDSLLNSHPLITPPDDDQVMREFTYQSASVLHLDWIDKFHTANCSCLSPRIDGFYREGYNLLFCRGLYRPFQPTAVLCSLFPPNYYYTHRHIIISWGGMAIENQSSKGQKWRGKPWTTAIECSVELLKRRPEI